MEILRLAFRLLNSIKIDRQNFLELYRFAYVFLGFWNTAEARVSVACGSFF